MVKALRVVLRIGYSKAGLVKKPAQVSLWVEGLEISGSLAGPDKFNGNAALALDSQGNAALC
jgi:hypothetical protein